MKRIFGTLLMLWIAFAAWIPCSANEVEEDENFVIASLLVASPGDVLYSCVGHACLRMQCPTHNLDYCFSYEGEPVKHQIGRFFAGKLKMGMFAFPTQQFLSIYKRECRGIKEYRLNLPLEAKRRLWKILDDKMMEGIELPYDYMKRGCAQTTIQFLVQALDTVEISFAPWSDKYNKTVRELTIAQLDNAPWNRLYLLSISGTKVDADCPPLERIAMPADLVEVLQVASINGRTVISKTPKELLQAKGQTRKTWFTPMILSITLLLLSLANIFLQWKGIDWTLLALQFLLGLFFSYLVFVSNLPCTEWSWLVIPFNPLPFVCWRWRKHWVSTFACVLLIWVLFMFLYPHQLTDWAYLPLVGSLILVYIRQYSELKQI